MSDFVYLFLTVGHIRINIRSHVVIGFDIHDFIIPRCQTALPQPPNLTRAQLSLDSKPKSRATASGNKSKFCLYLQQLLSALMKNINTKDNNYTLLYMAVFMSTLTCTW